MIRSILFFVFALIFAGGMFYFYQLSGPEVTRVENASLGIPGQFDELLLIQEPLTLAAKIENQKAYANLHPSVELVSILVHQHNGQADWFNEQPIYFVSANDSLTGYFGMPANWNLQEQESWLVSVLKAQPISSGSLVISGDKELQLTVGNDLCAFAFHVPSKPRFTPPSAQTIAHTIAINQFGKADFNQLILEHSIELPIVGKLPTQIIRDIHLGNQQLNLEELVSLNEAPIHLDAMPSAWIEHLPGDLTKLQGIGTKSGYALLELQMRRMNQSDLAAFNGELATYESQAGQSMQDLFEPWWSSGALHFEEENGGSYLLFGSVDQTIALNMFRSISHQELEPLLDGRMAEWSKQDTLMNHIFSLLGNERYSAAWIRPEAVIFAHSRENLVHLASTLAIGQAIDSSHPIALALNRHENFIQYGVSSSSAAKGLNLPAFDVEEGTPIHSVYSGMSMADGRFVTRYDLGTDTREAASIFMEWESALPPLRTETIQSIKNHGNGEYYIVIQDKANALHAIDARGKKMWTYQLTSIINSEIQSIDLYRNGKYQVAFSTSNGVYCLDLKGRNAEGFPIEPTSQITCPLFIADYDNNRNYRFLFGTEDGKLLNYHDEAQQTSGWQYSSGGKTAQHCAHIKAGNRDYLFVAMTDGSIRLLKRNGTDRFKSSLTIPEGSKDFAFQMTGEIETSSITMIDSMNVVLEARFGNGITPETTELAQALGILLTDLDRDRLNDLVLSSKTGISAYRSDHSKIFSREFENEPLPELRAYSFSSGMKTGVVIPGQTQIFLIEPDGSTAEGFPLYGASPFVIRDLDQDGKMELITTDGKSLVLCYQL